MPHQGDGNSGQAPHQGGESLGQAPHQGDDSLVHVPHQGDAPIDPENGRQCPEKVEQGTKMQGEDELNDEAVDPWELVNEVKFQTPFNGEYRTCPIHPPVETLVTFSNTFNNILVKW